MGFPVPVRPGVCALSEGPPPSGTSAPRGGVISLTAWTNSDRRLLPQLAPAHVINDQLPPAPCLAPFGAQLIEQGLSTGWSQFLLMQLSLLQSFINSWNWHSRLAAPKKNSSPPHPPPPPRFPVSSDINALARLAEGIRQRGLFYSDCAYGHYQGLTPRMRVGRLGVRLVPLPQRRYHSSRDVCAVE